MQDENKKALLYLGVAVAIVVGWIAWNKEFKSSNSTVLGNNVQEVKKVVDDTPKITNENLVEIPDGKGSLNEEENGNTRLLRWTKYTNTALGFSLGLPAYWYAPSAEDSDPRFYSCKYYECPMAFEIIRTDDLVSRGFDVVMASANDAQLRPHEIKLIPGARVIKSDAPVLTEGWLDQYLIMFPKENVGYTVYLNGWQAERLVLSTLRIAK
ncbi:MAG: hypothetical protein WCJ29_03995 [bacterium]